MYYTVRWDLNALILTPMVILLLSTIIIRKPHLHHICAIALSTIIGGIYGFSPFLSELFKRTFDANILMGVFYPIVIIRLIYAVDTYMFAKSIIQILIVSTIGYVSVVLSVGLIAEFTISRANVSLINCIMFGMLYHVSDIPEIVSKADGVKNLKLIIVGESFLSMVLTSVTFEILIGIYGGYVNEYYHIISLYMRYILIAVFVGLTCGYIFAFLLRKSYSDKTNAMLVILSSTYFGYALAEQIVHCSGVITSGLIVYIMSQERSGLSPQVDAEVRAYLNEVFEITVRIIVIIICLLTMIFFVQSYDSIKLIIAFFGYCIQITFRSIIFTILSAALGRLGYGFNFTSLIVLVWRPFKGPLLLLLVLKLQQEEVTKFNFDDSFIYLYVYYLFQSMVNRFMQMATLNRFNLGKSSPMHQNNVSNAIKILQNHRDKILAVMKMNRFFSGANWTLINNITKLQNPYESEDQNLFENVFSYSSRMTTCPKCFQRLHVQPTKAEIKDMSRAIRTRILKAQRISFVQQYEKGYLTKDQMNELLYAIDIALDSEDLFIRVDDFVKEIKESNFFQHLRVFLQKYLEIRDYEIPASRFKRVCRRISNHVLFEIVSFSITVVLIFDKIGVIAKGQVDAENILIESVTHILLILVFIIVFNSYSSDSLQEGFKKFFSYSWNGIDFASLIINSANLYVITIRYYYNEPSVNFSIIILKCLACIRILRVFKNTVAIYPKLTAHYDRKLDTKAYAQYTIGKAILVSYEDVVLQLDHLADDQSIKEALKIRLNSDKIALMEQLSVLLKIRPWVSVTVETKQAIKCTLKFMKTCVHDLKNAGIIDHYELIKMIVSLDERFKNIHSYKSIETLAPSNIFAEIPWTYDDILVHKHLDSHISNKIFRTGEVFCYNGDLLDTIVIVVQGMFKLYYKASHKVIRNLEENGQLPVKELINSNNFLDEQTDFIVIGNIIGEMSVLTERECSNTIVCYVPARALVLPKRVVYDAMLLNPNPVFGLWSRLWKKVAFNLVLRLLLDSVSYEASTPEKTILLLNDAFVPNLKNFKTLVLCEYVLDIVLVDGIVVDKLSKEVFKAPCYMPRPVKKYIFLKEYPDVILCIIPVKTVEPLDLMLRLEQDSELVDSPEGTLLASKYWDHSTQRSKTMTPSIKKPRVKLPAPEKPVIPESPKMCRCKRKQKLKEMKDSLTI